MKVKCNNEACPQFGKIEEVENWNGIDSLDLLNKTICPICKQKREIVRETISSNVKGFTGVGFGIIQSMNPAQRKEYLKKRSNEHFKKEIKPRKEYMDRKFYGKEK